MRSQLFISDHLFDKVVTNRKLRKESLTSPESIKYIQTCYRSDRLPNYDEIYKSQCNNLLDKLSIYDIPFLFSSSFCDPGNRAGNLNRQGHECLGELDQFFSNPENRYNYEAASNTFHFLKDYLYFRLGHSNGRLTVSDLFEDYPEKQFLVSDKLSDIAMELFVIRNALDARISIGNSSLISMVKKGRNVSSSSQDNFIEAVAFGSTLEELKRDDYSGAKRLIYVPHQKLSNL